MSLRDTWKRKKTDLPVTMSNSEIFNPNAKKSRGNAFLIKSLSSFALTLLFFIAIFRVGTNNEQSGLAHDPNNKLDYKQLENDANSALAQPPNQEEELPEGVELYDLKDYSSSPSGKENEDIVLLLIPLRNAEKVLPLMFRNMMNITYDHKLIDVAFLVSDCSEDDHTLETLTEYTNAMQKSQLLPLLEEREQQSKGKGVFGSSDLYQKYMPEEYIESVKNAYSPPFHEEYEKPFRSIQIYQKDFGQVIGQGFSDRHDVKIQGIRRKLMGRARNWLLLTALKPYHSWVYWRDVDIELSPGDILEYMMKFSKDYDVIIPNVWRPLPTFLGREQPYDLNSWIESYEGLKLAKSLDEDDVIVEGYAEYSTWRAHLAYIRKPDGDPAEIIDLDGVGGVSILAKASVFRHGANFPAFTFMNHAETEAFGKLCKVMGKRVGGLPHYTIWHIYEPSEDDLIEISRLERKKRRFGKS
ncbi:hypothetical protein CANINC_003428 [Pichia inconspicua]|uniref:Vanadate resistance protein n=1 Tax=Pichia inconspicua TaxID=52247 RepID=A0A4T0WYI5_9ASCO|nr:hypothetical protein CANINC_003428 [[Candida] inconspicua]